MSKQSDAKKAQNYVAKVVPQTCGNCANFKFDMKPPKWIVERNEQIESGKAYGDKYELEWHLKPANLRCGIGGFAVVKNGGCDLWEGKE